MPLQSNKPAATTPVRPWVGTYVHYVATVDGKPVCRAALVTEYAREQMNLTVFKPAGFEALSAGVVFSDDKRKPGTWHLPHG